MDSNVYSAANTYHDLNMHRIFVCRCFAVSGKSIGNRCKFRRRRLRNQFCRQECVICLDSFAFFFKDFCVFVIGFQKTGRY